MKTGNFEGVKLIKIILAAEKIFLW